jgi:hypothetical protein
MPTHSFTYNTKRSVQTGNLNVPVLSHTTKLYKRVLLTAGMGSMNKPPQLFTYPLMAFYFLQKFRASS